MIVTEEEQAAIWWQGLKPGERELWTGEALHEIGPDDPRRETDLPLACWRLYWSRGVQLQHDELEELSRGQCPHCHYRGFVIGPAGGASVNVECGNPVCRHRYNVVWFSGRALIGHRLPDGFTSEPWPSEPPP